MPTATYRATDFTAAARVLGVEVVVASEHRQALDRLMPDRAVVVPLDDPGAAADVIAALHERAPVDAVVGVDDQGVLAAAYASARLGLRHSPAAAVAVTLDKVAMREAFVTAAIPQPDFRIAGASDDVGELANEIGTPVVVKPVSLSASRGVIRADSPHEAARTAERVRRILAMAGEDPDGPLLVERFVAGTEIAVEGLVREGTLHVLAVFDKPDPLDGPSFEETLYVTPSRVPSATRIAVEHATRDAVGALGLTEGPIHSEFRIGREALAPDVTVLEVAARTIGGLCSRALRFGLGVSLEELVLRHALALPIADFARERGAAGVMMLPIPVAGTLGDVEGIDSARAIPGIEGVEITVPRGRHIQPLPEGDRYLGFLFARGDTPDAVERALRAGHAVLDVHITP